MDNIEPQIFIVRELVVKYKNSRKVRQSEITLSSPNNVWRFTRGIIGNDARESLIAIFLNNKNHLAGWTYVSQGAVSSSICHPREVMKAAVLANASSYLLVHNHPSGILSPSEDDIKTTIRMIEVGKLIGISMVDHIIISFESYYSLKENQQGFD